jgi:acyl-coenzyme A thioesterase PaaI-like protein
MFPKAFQDYYPDHLSYCYGCGRLNEHGLQIKSYWDGDAADSAETICAFTPRPEHIAIPGYVYGGLIASLIDCHCTGTAAAASYRAASREMDTEPPFRFVTASLHVNYLRPTPLGVPLEIRARVTELKGRKVVMQATLSAAGQVCAQGEVVAVQMPEHLAIPPLDSTMVEGDI